MQIFLETLTALWPLYFFMLVGALLRRAGVITDALAPPLNGLIFKAFLPISLFLNVYDAELNFSESVGAIVFVLCSYGLLFALLMWIVPRLVRERPVAATVVQGLYRSNFVLLGLAYAVQLFGKEKAGEASILIAVIVPLFNVLAVIDFALLGGGGKPKPRDILLRILKNPLILAALLALVLRLAGFRLPGFVHDPLNTLAGVATPFAMVVVGSSLTLRGFRKNGRCVAIVTAVHLLAVPAVFLPLAVLLGFRGVTLIAFLTAFAGPCAVSSSAMAYQMGGDGELAGQLVAATSVASLLTMYLFIVLLRTLGFC